MEGNVMQQSHDQFYAVLRESVEERRRAVGVAVSVLDVATKNYESASKLLEDFERLVLGREPESRPVPTEDDVYVSMGEGVGEGSDEVCPPPRRDGTPLVRGPINKDGTYRKKPGPVKGLVKAKLGSYRHPDRSQETQERDVLEGSGRPGPKPNSKRDGVPSLISAIQMVVGRKTVNADQVFESLKAKSWLPNSQDPLNYIRYTLSKNKEVFLRVEGRRGFYYLQDGGPKGLAEVEKPWVSTSQPSVARLAPVAISNEETNAVVEEVDNLLAKSGVDLSGADPFSDSA